MDDVALDAVTRRAALVSLGATGLVATFATTSPAGAKNKAKKLKKKQQQKCQSQVEQCIAVTHAYCEEISENPEELQACLDDDLPCCDFLARCDAAAYLLCID